MSIPNKPVIAPDNPKPDKRESDAKAERLAQQLRENLFRRKAQARGQKEQKGA